jgi:peptidylprolyl isomerase
MRILKFIIAASLALSVTGCGQSSEEEEKKDETPKASQTEPAKDEKPSSTAQPAAPASGKERVVMEVKGGKVVIELRPDLAPRHVERIKQLSREGFYNGLKFHRVIDGFMAQTGDPTGTGMSGSKYPDLPSEFSPEPYKRGTVGAARTSNPNSANSQFFICFTDNGCSSLTGKYTVWGQVVEGMEYIDKVKRGEGASGMVTDPDIITKMSLE